MMANLVKNSVRNVSTKKLNIEPMVEPVYIETRKSFKGEGKG